MFGDALAVKTHDSIPANIDVKAVFSALSEANLSVNSSAQKGQSSDQLWRIMVSLVSGLRVENNKRLSTCGNSTRFHALDSAQLIIHKRLKPHTRSRNPMARHIAIVEDEIAL